MGGVTWHLDFEQLLAEKENRNNSSSAAITQGDSNNPSRLQQLLGERARRNQLSHVRPSPPFVTEADNPGALQNKNRHLRRLGQTQ